MLEDIPHDTPARRVPSDCPEVSALHAKIDHQERRQNTLEQKTDQKLDELINYSREVVKLQERNNRNSDDINNLRQAMSDNARMNAESLIRIHSRLDIDMKEARDAKKESDHAFLVQQEKDILERKILDSKIIDNKSEFDKFKHIGYGIAVCLGIIIGMGQYIVNNTLSEIRDSITAIKDLTLKTDNRFITESVDINKKLNAQAQVNQEVDEQLRKLTEKVRGQSK